MFREKFRALKTKYYRVPVNLRRKVQRYLLVTYSLGVVVTFALPFLGWGVTGEWGQAGFGDGLLFSGFVGAWILLLNPWMVRWGGRRTRLFGSLYEKESIAYLAAALTPSVIFFSMVCGGLGLWGSHAWRHFFDHPWVFFYLAGFDLLLVTQAVFLAVKDRNTRMVDSLRVLANAMKEASKMDFDHTILTVERDEIGVLSDIFNTMATLLKLRVQFLQTLFNNVRIFSGLLSEDKILDHIPDTFQKLEEAEEIVVALSDESERSLRVVRSSTGRAEVLGLVFHEGEGILGRVLSGRQYLALPGEQYREIAQSSPAEYQLWGKPDYVVGIPILFKNQIKGAVVFYNLRLSRSHLEDTVDHLQGLANQIGIFLENARLYSLVIHDRLTGFFTHAYLESELIANLARAKRESTSFCFLMIDLDHFKQVNDQEGHATGNRLLTAVTKTIRSALRASDIPARFGGDEFEVLLPNTDKAAGLVCAQKIHAAVKKMEFKTDSGEKLKIGLSMGLAAYPKDATTAAELQGAADSALYKAKEGGRNQIKVYAGISSS